jgi:hypothetical protein
VDGSGSSSDVYVQSGGYDGDTYDMIFDGITGSYNVNTYQLVTGQPVGAGFTASVWAETSSLLNAGYLQVLNSSGTQLCLTYIPGNISSWTQYNCTGTVGSDGTLEFNLGSNPESSNQWLVFDSASLTD